MVIICPVNFFVIFLGIKSAAFWCHCRTLPVCESVSAHWSSFGWKSFLTAEMHHRSPWQAFIALTSKPPLWIITITWHYYFLVLRIHFPVIFYLKEVTISLYCARGCFWFLKKGFYLMWGGIIDTPLLKHPMLSLFMGSMHKVIINLSLLLYVFCWCSY